MDEGKILQAMQTALDHHRQGRLVEAIAAYRQAIALRNNFAEAYSNLGVALTESGQVDEAIAACRQAIAFAPEFGDAYFNLGNALAKHRRMDEAIAAYRQAIALKPDHLEALSNLGVALQDTGNLEEAIACHRRAISFYPGRPETYNNLGNALNQKGRPDEAIASFRQAIALHPSFPEAHLNLGNAWKSKGELEAAIAAYHQALVLRPDYPDAQNNLGNALRERGQLEEAIAAYRRAIALRPGDSDTFNNLGVALTESHRPEEAIAAYRQAIALKPDAAQVYSHLGVALKDAGRLDEAVAMCHQALALKPDYFEAYNNLGNALKDVGQLDEAIAAYRQAIAIKPDFPDAQSNLLYTLHFHHGYDARAIRDAHREWSDRYAAPLAGQIKLHENNRDENRRLRIGYVSADFRTNVLALYFAPLLSRHDRRQVEVFCYSNVSAPDEMTRRLLGYADQWRDITGIPDGKAAEMIRRDRIDILVDTTLHMARNRLPVFARKPAPVQVTYIGYPGTTGLGTIDYRLTDPYLDPPGEHDDFYSEKSIRLPDSFWCYDPLTDEPAINPLPASAGVPITFGCLNNFCKVNRQMLLLWARVMRQVKDSRMILLADAGSHRDRTLAVLAEGGVDSSRIEFVGKRPRADYLTLYHRIDLCLDTFPYNGHTTSLDSLWMGVPVVNLCGQTAVSRAGLCQCANLGLMELVANSPEEFVRLAAGLANDLPRLAELRRTLRDRLQASPLMNAERFIGNLESAYRQMWRTWCRTGEVTIQQAMQTALDHHQQGQTAEAESIYRQILSQDPNHANTYNNLGIALNSRGRIDEAIAAYRQAIALHPSFPEAYYNLGNALKSKGELETAIAAYRQALAVRPDYFDAQNNLGNALKERGRLEEAIVAYRQAIALAPGDSEVFNNLGVTLNDAGRKEEAIVALGRSIALRPGFAEAYSNLGIALNDSGRPDDAIAAYRKAISLQPNLPEAHNNLGNAMKDLGRLDEAVAAYRQAVACRSTYAAAHSNLVYTLHFHPDYDARALFESNRAWDRQHAEPLAGRIRAPDNDRDENRRLRIGYVSADFRDHVQALYFAPMLHRHDRKQVEVYCYSNVAVPDGMTRLLRESADQWRDITGVPDDAAAEMIRRDRIDILVDTTLHMARNRLLVFACKPAPIQVSWLGYPGTTGLSTIDYRLTDPYLDPPGEHDEFYSEKSIRLPDSFWCYDPLTDEPAINPLPASAGVPITFGCLNNFCKVNRQMLLLWARVMRQVKDSRMMILADAGSHRDRTLAELAEAGVEPGRIEFVGKRPRADYLTLYHRIDLCLDTFPYNGHTTSLDSLWMGVPVVSLCGQTAVSRAGLCQCANLGLMELVAHSPEEFVRIAMGLANDLPRLAELRRTLRGRIQNSPLMNAGRFVANLESAYRQMWKTWCKGKS